MLPDALTVKEGLDGVLDALAHESPELRPKDQYGKPGGLVILQPLPTLILPDLHARRWFVEGALDFVPGGDRGGERGMSGGREEPESSLAFRDLLAVGKANLVFVGDGINSEGSVAVQLRWSRAFEEYCRDWTAHQAMDEEMDEALGTMLLVMKLKSEHPCNVHFLKGNHDNLANRTDGGDRRFYKYSAESEMGASWFEWKYGSELLAEWRRFELALPLVAIGDVTNPEGGFAVSHAEPARFLAREKIIEYRDDTEEQKDPERNAVVHSLIWTDNDGAEPGSVARTLESLGLGAKSLWFAGHRHVESRHALSRQGGRHRTEDGEGAESGAGYRYASRAEGRLVQFHSRIYTQGVFLVPGRRFFPDRDIVSVGRG